MVFPLRKGPSGPLAELTDGSTLSNVFFVDGGTVVPTEDQNGSIATPFATLAQVIELFTDYEALTAVLTDNLYDDFTLDAPKTLNLVAWSEAQIVNVTLQNGASLLTNGILINNITVEESQLQMVRSSYNICTLNDPVVARFDLYTLGVSRLVNGSAPPTGPFEVLDAPTVTKDISISPLTAPDSQLIIVPFVGARPGDTFTAAGLPDLNPWPTEAILGVPYCTADDEVIVPIMAVGDDLGSASCSLRVTQLAVSSG